MIRHLVLFRLAASEPAQRADDTAGIRSHLAALVGVVPGLRSVTVEPELGLVDGHWDVALISEHDSNAALEGYQAHPAHQSASSWISGVVTDRAVVDLEVAD
jgi:hypothetical protein